jgi:KaiC/GvpD/RAD55 family RecA-like ATPase
LASSGFASLDSLIGSGGYPDESAVLIVSPPGIAKEVLGYRFIYAGLSHGDFCVYATRFSPKDIMRDAKAFGVDYKERVPLWIANRGGQIKLEINDLPGLSFNVKELLKKNSDRKIRIVIDIISSLLILNQPDTIYRFLTQLFDEIKSNDAVLLATLEDGMHLPQVVTAMEQLFDGVIELKLFEEDMRARPLLRILKMRGAQVQQGYFGFSFSNDGMEVSPYAK